MHARVPSLTPDYPFSDSIKGVFSEVHIALISRLGILGPSPLHTTGIARTKEEPYLMLVKRIRTPSSVSIRSHGGRTYRPVHHKPRYTGRAGIA
jgi:hypothetical protein